MCLLSRRPDGHFGSTDWQRPCRRRRTRALHALQIATAGPGEYFGEESLQKESKASTSVLAQSSVGVFIINKWDLLKMLSADHLAAFSQAAIIGNIDETLLKEQFYR